MIRRPSVTPDVIFEMRKILGVLLDPLSILETRSVPVNLLKGVLSRMLRKKNAAEVEGCKARVKELVEGIMQHANSSRGIRLVPFTKALLACDSGENGSAMKLVRLNKEEYQAIINGVDKWSSDEQAAVEILSDPERLIMRWSLLFENKMRTYPSAVREAFGLNESIKRGLNRIQGRPGAVHKGIRLLVLSDARAVVQAALKIEEPNSQQWAKTLMSMFAKRISELQSLLRNEQIRVDLRHIGRAHLEDVDYAARGGDWSEVVEQLTERLL